MNCVTFFKATRHDSLSLPTKLLIEVTILLTYNLSLSPTFATASQESIKSNLLPDLHPLGISEA